MSPQDMAAMTSQTKGMSGPAMMFATVGSGSPSDGESDVKLTQDETGVVGNRLQQVCSLPLAPCRSWEGLTSDGRHDASEIDHVFDIYVRHGFVDHRGRIIHS